MKQGSLVREMFETGIALKRQYGAENVFDLSLGNPVMEPPKAFRDILRRLVESSTPGLHRYMPNAGYPETRAAVARQLAEETSTPFTEDEIVMCVGAGGGLNVVLKAILNPGDEIVILTPYFLEYIFYINNHGGKPVVVPCDQEFVPDLTILRERITARTKVVIVNSPNNPSGAVYTPGFLAKLGLVLLEKETEYKAPIYLVSDEPYRKVIYDDLVYPHVYQHHARSIAVTSYSKDLALPGERIGYIAINPGCPDKEELLNALVFCTRTLGFVNAPALMQHVVRNLQGITINIAAYQQKRDFLHEKLTQLKYRVFKPAGAFYMFPEAPESNDFAFVERLLRCNVLAVPGTSFGMPGYFRLSYCVEDEVLEGAVRGFTKVAHEMRML